MSSLTWLDALSQDFRFGARTLRKKPGFAAIVVLTLALGIGASTAVFSLIDAVLLRAAPFPHSDQLVLLWTPDPRFIASVQSVLGTDKDFAFTVFSPLPGDFYDIQAQNKSFNAMATYSATDENLSTGPGADSIRAQVSTVNGNFFSILGAAPELGRPITGAEDEPGQEKVAVISHALWVSKYSQSPDVIGKTIQIAARPYRIIGVMPPEFRFPLHDDVDVQGTNTSTDAWIPFAYNAKQRADHEGSEAQGGNALARMRPGVTLEQAGADVNAVLDHNRQLHQPDTRGFHALITPFAATRNMQSRKPLLLLLGAVALVLLIACSNVAGLLLARAAQRAHEFTVRAALGAGRIRLVRQLLTESVLLSLAGGALGAALAYSAVRVITRLDTGNIPRLDQAAINPTVLFFALGISLVSSIVFGLAPALSASRPNLGPLIAAASSRTIKQGSRRLQQSLIVLQVALSVMLLAGSGLFIRSLLKLGAVDPGFQTSSTLTGNISLDERYNSPEKQTAFFSAVLQKAAQLPGVNSAALSSGIPLSKHESISTWGQIEGHPFDRQASFESRQISPGYLSAMRIPLLAGRDFNDADVAGHPDVAIVNRGFVRKYFPGEMGVGKHVYPVDENGVRTNSPPLTIVGVVADVRQWALDQPTSLDQYYLPFTQNSSDRFDLILRTAAPPATLIPQIRAIVKSVDPDVAFANPHTLEALVSDATAPRRFQTVILTSFAGIALFLSLVGLYALMAYTVRQRTSEIGVRMALGAQPADVLRMILRRGLVLALMGAAAGIAIALASSRVVARFLFGVSALDPLTLAAAIALLLTVALAACLIPALRAARIDPTLALRHE